MAGRSGARQNASELRPRALMRRVVAGAVVAGLLFVVPAPALARDEAGYWDFADKLSRRLTIRGFVPALLAAIIISLTGSVVDLVLH